MLPLIISIVHCVWDDSGFPLHPEQMNAEYEEDPEAWIEKQPMVLPKTKEYNGYLDAVKKTVSPNGTLLQCILVKLANIVLTPEKPEFWHAEDKSLYTLFAATPTAASYICVGNPPSRDHLLQANLVIPNSENITASSLGF